MAPDPTASSVIRQLDLLPHPEGGWFKEMFRDSAPVSVGSDGTRGASTAIYYLLQAGEVSAWHRVDAAEVWHYYAGASLALTVSANGQEASTHRLGMDLAAGERPQRVVP